MSELPVVVIGAGPQGLAAAAHLVERGEDVVVVERGQGAASAVSEWGHVRLFSAWPELTDSAARRLLEPTGWSAPASGYPTGAEWVSDYLAPLAGTLGGRIRYATTVTGVARHGRDKVVDAGRRSSPFVVHTVDVDGVESRILARAVVDASGTWGMPNPAGADGFPAVGERAASDLISYRIPADVAELAGELRHVGRDAIRDEIGCRPLADRREAVGACRIRHAPRAARIDDGTGEDAGLDTVDVDGVHDERRTPAPGVDDLVAPVACDSRDGRRVADAASQGARERRQVVAHPLRPGRVARRRSAPPRRLEQATGGRVGQFRPCREQAHMPPLRDGARSPLPSFDHHDVFTAFDQMCRCGEALGSRSDHHDGQFRHRIPSD